MPAPKRLSAAKRLAEAIAQLEPGPSHADLAVPMDRKMLPGRCDRCRHRGYTVARHPQDGRPWFKCGHCNAQWTCGRHGGTWLTAAGLEVLLSAPAHPQHEGVKG